MYYEEKVIDGVLHFRTRPDGDFKPLTDKELTNRLVSAEKDLREICAMLSTDDRKVWLHTVVNAVQEFVNGLPSPHVADLPNNNELPRIACCPTCGTAIGIEDDSANC